MILGFPLQGIIVKFLFNARKKGIKITDSRVRLLQEVCLPVDTMSRS
jgi:ATP-binding cassette subfamily C (CFTR/MRP) protein 1